MYPKVIYFCNKTISSADIKSAQRWKELNPDYQLMLFGDDAIKTFLKDKYGELFLQVFNFLEDGPIKADFWRICVLYMYGGIYSDIDNQPFVPLSTFVEDNIDFLTCTSYWEEKFKFNPNFIIANRGSPILKKCIDWYIEKFNRRDKYDYWDWSIMNCFSQVLVLENYVRESSIHTLDNMKIQILKECPGEGGMYGNHYDAHTKYHNIRVFNNRLPNWNCDKHCFE